MAKEITVELTEPVTTHQGQVRTWVLREPKAKDSSRSESRTA